MLYSIIDSSSQIASTESRIKLWFRANTLLQRIDITAADKPIFNDYDLG